MLYLVNFINSSNISIGYTVFKSNRILDDASKVESVQNWYNNNSEESYTILSVCELDI